MQQPLTRLFYFIQPLLLLCFAGVEPAVAQSFLPSQSYIRQQVVNSVFRQRPSTTIPDNGQCITTANAKAWLYLDETKLPADNRMPWYAELVPLTFTDTCAATDAVMYSTSDPNYSSCDSMIYSSFNISMTAFVRTPIPITNQYWIGAAADKDAYCSYTPRTSATVAAMVNNVMVRSDGITRDTIPKNVSAGVMAMDAATTVYGPLNRCGVWGSDHQSPADVWQHFNVHVYAPASKQYYIGMGADNFFRLRIDNVLLVDFEGDSEAFKIWHIIPVTLAQGNHIISLEAKNVGEGSPGSFGAEIYNNTAAEISNATTDTQLNIVFSTRNMIGQKICAMAN